MQYKLLPPKKVKIKLVTTKTELDKVVQALEVPAKNNPIITELYQTLYEAYWAFNE